MKVLENNKGIKELENLQNENIIESTGLTKDEIEKLK
jgi:hypothetical protein